MKTVQIAATAGSNLYGRVWGRENRPEVDEHCIVPKRYSASGEAKILGSEWSGDATTEDIEQGTVGWCLGVEHAEEPFWVVMLRAVVDPCDDDYMRSIST